MILPFLIFWILIVLGRRELGVRGVLAAVLVWVVLLLVCTLAGLSSYVFVAAQAILDCVLILIVVRGDVRIR